MDSEFVISLSLAGITIITALVVMVNILTGRSKDGKKPPEYRTKLN